MKKLFYSRTGSIIIFCHSLKFDKNFHENLKIKTSESTHKIFPLRIFMNTSLNRRPSKKKRKEEIFCFSPKFIKKKTVIYIYTKARRRWIVAWKKKWKIKIPARNFSISHVSGNKLKFPQGFINCHWHFPRYSPY